MLKSSWCSRNITAQGSEQTNHLDVQAQQYANAFIKIDEELKALSSSHQISLMIKPKILQSKGIGNCSFEQ